MDSISKHRREGNEDRISNLPKSLIGHILSFLPTKNAVATCILSTKWKYLWTSITTLDFNDELVVVPENNKEKQSLVDMSFINFVYRVLARNISDLQKFHLRCTRSYDVSHLNVWVSIALSRNLRELHLSNLWTLPRELFTCTSLVVLKLCSRSQLPGTFVINVPTLVRLHSLKILVIDSFGLDDNSICRLFTGQCPVLEDLSIRNCAGRDISVLKISAPLLKRLTINGLYSCHYKIVLNTPNLQGLEYKGFSPGGYLVNKLNALVKASLRLLGHCVTDGSKFAVAEFVKSLSKVQWLYLSGGSTQIFRLCKLSLPKFDRLTYLEFGYGDYYVRWEWVLDFVKRSPQLETLIYEGDVEELDWSPPEQVPSCLLFHLKEIECKRFEGRNNELKMVEYLLENSKVLEKLVIRALDRRKLEICQKVLMLPRGSTTCRVEVL